MGVPRSSIGIAVKIESESMDLMYVAIADILSQLQDETDELRNALQHWRTPQIFNTIGVTTGETSHCFKKQKR